MIKLYVLPVLWAAISALGYAMMCGLRSKKLIYVSIGGAASWLVYLLSMRTGLIEVLCYAVAAGVGTVYSEIMVRVMKTPVTAFVIPVNVALVPGAAMFYSLLALMQKDIERFVDRGKYALSVACAMALGIFVATMIFRLIKSAAEKRHVH